MSNPVVSALEKMAERLGPKLGKDAAGAIEKMYRDVGDGGKKIAEDMEKLDAEHQKKLLDLADKLGKNEAKTATTAAEASAKKAEQAALQRKIKDILQPTKLRNGDLAGGVHPKTGVPFDEEGYPDFSNWRHPDVPDVQIELTGDRGKDFAAANAQAGLSETPSGYTWHHHQDPGKMQLIDRTVHAKTGHTGGFSKGKK